MSYLGDYPTVGIVGSYEQVAERLDDLAAIGADALILSGLPHLEEAYRVGEEVLPLFGASRPAPAVASVGVPPAAGPVPPSSDENTRPRTFQGAST